MPKRALIVFAGIAILAVAGTAGWQWYFQLPAPQRATNQQVLRWLVFKDLEQESLETRVALVDRLQEMPAESFNQNQGGKPQLSASYRERLKRNAKLLQADWFEHRCRQYANCEMERRLQFLEAQLEAVLRWSELSKWWSASDAAESGLSAFFGQIQTWLDWKQI